MIRHAIISTVLFLFASAPLTAATNQDEVVTRVYLDARTVERVASVTHRDLPKPILMRILDEDLDLLRARNDDGTFELAHFERTESGRVIHGTKVDDGGQEKRMDRKELRARHVFRLIIGVPSRRMLVTRNQPVYVEKVDFDYVNERGEKRFQTIDVDQIVRSGDEKAIDIPEIASDVVATVHARSMARVANLELILVRAELVDNSDSPFFGAVQSVKLLKTAIERDDITTTESLAATLAERLAPRYEAIVAPSSTGATTLPSARETEILAELQRIEDLLNGSEQQRREGLDRLQRLLRRSRLSTPPNEF